MNAINRSKRKNVVRRYRMAAEMERQNVALGTIARRFHVTVQTAKKYLRFAKGTH